MQHQDKSEGIWVPPGTRLPQAEPVAAEPVEAPAAETVDERVAAAEAQAAELKDKYLRALAESDNIRRRSTEQIRVATERANERFLTRLLPVTDAVGRALAAAATGGSLESLIEGLSLVERQLTGFLESEGVAPVAAEPGDEFDPERHEAMMRGPITEEIPEGHIIELVEPGYTLHGRILRPARVVVAAPDLDVEA